MVITEKKQIKNRYKQFTMTQGQEDTVKNKTN